MSAAAKSRQATPAVHPSEDHFGDELITIGIALMEFYRPDLREALTPTQWEAYQQLSKAYNNVVRRFVLEDNPKL